MLYFHAVQLLLAAVVARIVYLRVRTLLFDAPIDTKPFLTALLAAVADGDRGAARALCHAGRPAWVAALAAVLLAGEPADELLSDLRYEAAKHLWALRVLGSVATALGFLGAVLEIVWLLQGDHGLAGLKAGLPQSMALQGAIVSVGVGVATAAFAWFSLATLRKASRGLLGDLHRVVLELEGVGDAAKAP